MKVRFPDGTQIQGTFAADETVGDIYEFVREQLAQDVAFHLRIALVDRVTVDLVPKGELGVLTQTIREAGFSPRTLLMFTWSLPRHSRALKDDVLQDAVDIENVAKGLLDEPQSSQKDKAKDKGKGVATNDTKVKLPKWMGKLSKK